MIFVGGIGIVDRVNAAEKPPQKLGEFDVTMSEGDIQKIFRSHGWIFSAKTGIVWKNGQEFEEKNVTVEPENGPIKKYRLYLINQNLIRIRAHFRTSEKMESWVLRLGEPLFKRGTEWGWMEDMSYAFSIWESGVKAEVINVRKAMELGLFTKGDIEKAIDEARAVKKKQTIPESLPIPR
jgi:hypothetical protein